MSVSHRIPLLLCVIVGTAPGCGAPPPIPDTVTFSRSASSEGCGWTLTVDKEGMAVLQLHSIDYGPERLSLAQRIESLQQLLREIDAFSLPREVGRGVPDGGRDESWLNTVACTTRSQFTSRIPFQRPRERIKKQSNCGRSSANCSTKAYSTSMTVSSLGQTADERRRSSGTRPGLRDSVDGSVEAVQQRGIAGLLEVVVGL